jgi:hypothetical protein
VVVRVAIGEGPTVLVAESESGGPAVASYARMQCRVPRPAVRL